jgi:pyridoxine/pyridoxamine 5'-phosphate oxidase
MSDKDLFVERRAEGDFAVRRANSQRASLVAVTQAEAIAEARKLEPDATVLVERVRRTSVGKPDKWRKP